MSGWLGAGCHCGAVRFEVHAPPEPELVDCNCSRCARLGYLHLIVGRESFRLVRGQDHLTTYRFGSQTAQHLFCSVCGIQSFYVPRSHPDGFSVNARCLDDPQVASGWPVRPFDGQHWEAAIGDLI